MRWSVRIFVLALFLVSVSLGAADDPLIGTWKLNVAKSKYSPGPPPRSTINKYEPSGNGVKFTQDVEDAQGNSTHVEYTAKYDGKDYPSSGNPSRDMVSWTPRTDPSTNDGTIKKGGKVIASFHRAVSKDGKTMTVTVQGTKNGQPYREVHVFDKQ